MATKEPKSKTAIMRAPEQDDDESCEEQLSATQECLRRFVDDEPCHMNAAGQCTTAQHGGIPGSCRVADAREVLGMDANIDDPYTDAEKAKAKATQVKEVRDSRTD